MKLPKFNLIIKPILIKIILIINYEARKRNKLETLEMKECISKTEETLKYLREYTEQLKDNLQNQVRWEITWKTVTY